jgi:acrylyl-CoA reductase (NADPH)
MAFKAILLEEKDGKVSAAVTALDEARLPPGEVTVRVAYSTLNYKDGLILKGLARLVRAYPHVPGIDFAGTVAASSHPGFAAGDAVVLNGWGVGERHWGGMAERARVNGEWLVKLPAALSPRRAMAIGTAGYTAMLSVMALEDHGLRRDAPVLVTGAAGGVGSVAVAILAKLGYRVAAATGRPAEADYLRALGAGEIVERAAFAAGPQKPLDAGKWAGCVDTVGGKVLAAALSQMNYGAPVAACGNAAGIEVPASVLPFILRGVNLLGIDSVMCPLPRREAAWARLARDLPIEKLDAMTRVVPLAEAPALADAILKGQIRGRTVIDVGA